MTTSLSTHQSGPPTSSSPPAPAVPSSVRKEWRRCKAHVAPQVGKVPRRLFSSLIIAPPPLTVLQSVKPVTQLPTINTNFPRNLWRKEVIPLPSPNLLHFLRQSTACSLSLLQLLPQASARLQNPVNESLIKPAINEYGARHPPPRVRESTR